MKRFFLIGLILMVSVGVAIGAARLTTTSATSTTTTAAYAIAVANDRSKPVAVGITITATDALADVVILDGNGTKTMTTATLAASATSVGVSSCTGLNESTSVVIANSNGDTSEVLVVSGCTTSNLVFTAASNTYRTDASIHEIDTLYTYSNVGTGTQTLQENFLIGYDGGPLVGKITAATGTATIVLTTDYR